MQHKTGYLLKLIVSFFIGAAMTAAIMSNIYDARFKELKSIIQKESIQADSQQKIAEDALRKVIEARKEKILNQIKLDEAAQFQQSAEKNRRLLARVDSLEKGNVPVAFILSEFEKDPQ